MSGTSPSAATPNAVFGVKRSSSPKSSLAWVRRSGTGRVRSPERVCRAAGRGWRVALAQKDAEAKCSCSVVLMCAGMRGSVQRSCSEQERERSEGCVGRLPVSEVPVYTGCCAALCSRLTCPCAGAFQLLQEEQLPSWGASKGRAGEVRARGGSFSPPPFLFTPVLAAAGCCQWRG